MNFILRYRGPLPSGNSKSRQADTHAIRTQLAPQLRLLCETSTPFASALRGDLESAALKGSRIEPPRDRTGNPVGPLFWRVAVGGLEFVPLVTRPHELVCELSVIWLRAGKPGDIVHGGDLDNRLKSLFDGLTIPHQAKELPKGAGPSPGGPMLCLLEDDALIQRLTVSTHQLLIEEAAMVRNDVDLILNVLVKAGAPMIDNLAFPS